MRADERPSEPRDAHPRAIHPLWVQLALSLGAFSIGTVEFGSMSLLPEFTRDFGVSAAAGGQAISAYALGVVVGAPLLALWGASQPRRRLLASLMAVFAFGNASAALAPTFPSFVLTRFLSGLPHGGYLGVACVLAAGLSPPEQRSRAVARVMMGLTLATVIGVPVVSGLGRALGWRWLFGLVALLAALTSGAILLTAPRSGSEGSVGWRRELAALGHRQIWLTLGIGAIGQGGMFAIYSYLASTLDAAGAEPAALSTAFLLFGVGLTVSLVVTGRLADKSLVGAMIRCLVWSVATMSLYALSVEHVSLVLLSVFLVGCGGALGVPVQTRLMDVSGDAQTMAAALNHAAFNVANALGPACAGAALAAGLGWAATGWVGALLSLGGLGMLAWALADERRAAAPTS